MVESQTVTDRTGGTFALSPHEGEIFKYAYQPYRSTDSFILRGLLNFGQEAQPNTTRPTKDGKALTPEQLIVLIHESDITGVSFLIERAISDLDD